jgi:hypothetical protein
MEAMRQTCRQENKALAAELRAEAKSMRAELNERFERVDARFDVMNARFDALQRTLIAAILAGFIGLIVSNIV